MPSKDERFREAMERDSVSMRLRSRLGLAEDSSDKERVADWMKDRGAIPVTLFVIALGTYLIISVVVAVAT